MSSKRRAELKAKFATIEDIPFPRSFSLFILKILNFFNFITKSANILQEASFKLQLLIEISYSYGKLEVEKYLSPLL